MAKKYKMRSMNPDAIRKRLKYRTDPAFRTKVLAERRAHEREKKSDPDYCRCRALTKLIYQARERVDTLMERLDKADKQLVALVQEYEQLRKKRAYEAPRKRVAGQLRLHSGEAARGSNAGTENGQAVPPVRGGVRDCIQSGNPLPALPSNMSAAERPEV